ncbi:MAG: hypothetical protein ABI809_06485, partial [Caldimonas sp.]
PEPIVLGRMVIGEGAGRGGVRHHAGGRGGNGGGRARRGGSAPGHGGSGGGHANRSGNDARGGSSSAGSNGGARTPSRDQQGQPRPQGPRPEARRDGRPPARLTQPKR